MLIAASAFASDNSESFTLDALVGSWVGKSTDGSFEEHTDYNWSDDKSYLGLSMTFYVDGQNTGSATGYMLIDDATGDLLFEMISSQGVRITQRRLSGDSNDVEMSATSINGARAGMPEQFRTRIHVDDKDHYSTEMLISDGGDWQVVMKNEFHRRSRSDQVQETE
jgi:hypothetical protein